MKTTIYPGTKKYRNATVFVPNVNLPLLDRQRRTLMKLINENQKELKKLAGLENFLNEICDTWFFQKQQKETSPDQVYVLFADTELTRINYSEGFQAMVKYIKKYGSDFDLHTFDHRTPVVDILDTHNGADYLILTPNEFKKLQNI